MKAMPNITLRALMNSRGFKPNPQQLEAIEHGSGPLFLMAGPGSGKTRVLLWRTLNLLVFKGVKAEQIFLSTFTEKAARQLVDGLRTYLAEATKFTGRPYDISQMYVGTTHGLCQRILSDTRFSAELVRPVAPRIIDEVDQFLLINRTLKDGLKKRGLKKEDCQLINAEVAVPQKKNSSSYHETTISLANLFNRLAEETVEPKVLRKYVKENNRHGLSLACDIYSDYLAALEQREEVDFSHLQLKALEALNRLPFKPHHFEHVIVDEYQDTNPVQEKIYHALAKGSKNLCVVGDDDQALYRFRGATVENFVQFRERAAKFLGVKSIKSIPLDINYRSKSQIVEFYKAYIDQIDWSAGKGKSHRIVDKRIKAHRKSEEEVVYITESSDKENKEAVADEVANKVRMLIKQKIVSDPNEVACLFYSVGSRPARDLRDALREAGIEVYAPRAGSLYNAEEVMCMIGIFALIMGCSTKDILLEEYRDWLETAIDFAKSVVESDEALGRYIKLRRAEASVAINDYQVLSELVAAAGFALKDEISAERIKSIFSSAVISDSAKRTIEKYLERERRNVRLAAIVKRASATDWGLLDLFYQLGGFDYFKKLLRSAEEGIDEGPAYNLGALTHILSRFNEGRGPVISGKILADHGGQFFNGHLMSLWRIGQGEVETDKSDSSFPKGRVPFLTIHQSKGLEFPVVILGDIGSTRRSPSKIEELMRELVSKPTAEPLERIDDFDVARRNYVALSRAQDLLILCNQMHANKPAFLNILNRAAKLSKLRKPKVEPRETEPLPKAYSYTADFLYYQKCPRQYMYFRRHNFVPAHTQTMFFGSLVHRTLEDLHNLLISRRK